MNNACKNGFVNIDPSRLDGIDCQMVSKNRTAAQFRLLEKQ